VPVVGGGPVEVDGATVVDDPPGEVVLVVEPAAVRRSPCRFTVLGPRPVRYKNENADVGNTTDAKPPADTVAVLLYPVTSPFDPPGPDIAATENVFPAIEGPNANSTVEYPEMSA
jgi:hypothetical protein